MQRVQGFSRSRQVPSWYYNANFRRFRENYKTSHPLQLFVGSGLSIGAGYPSWRDLLTEIRVKAEEEHLIYVPSVPDFDRLIQERQYGEAGDMLREAFGNRQWAWREILDEIFSERNRHPRENPALRALMGLDWSRILTTNYDVLLESFDQHIKVFHPDMEGYERCQHEKARFIFKLHGDISDPNSEIVLTKRDYDRLYGGSYGAESEANNVDAQSSAFRGVLSTLLSTYSLTLVIGYGHEDPYVRGLFKHLVKKNAGNRVFAVVPIADRDKVLEFQEKHRDIAADTGIYFIPYDKQGKNDHSELTEFLDFFRDPMGLDEEFRAREAIRRPTVVLINAGGTIGSLQKDEGRGTKVGLPKESDRFEEKIERDTHEIISRFRSIYDRGSRFDFDIKWEFLDSSRAILSENATSDHWNNLLTTIDEVIYKYIHGPLLVGNDYEIKDARLMEIYEQHRDIFSRRNPDKPYTVSKFVDDFKGRFVEGIIVLHGTDTLSYTAAAMAFGIEHLPCAIVLTGSNLPPDEGLLERKSMFYWKSDAWNNIVTSIYFLKTLGHRYTEVFVCFGQTVHHGVNLRKVNTELMPINPNILEIQRIETFGFRNIQSHQQYMFRIIDGIFCNNYYPIGDHHHEEICTNLNTLRHARIDPFSSDSQEETIFRHFYPCVVQIKATPMFPHFNAKSLQEAGQVRTVLLEGYESGTFPTSSGHPLRNLLEELILEGIPLALVSRHGMLGSQAEYEMELDIPVLRLFGIIAETAAPLLSLVVGGISEAAWSTKNKELTPTDRLKMRISLIQHELRNYLASRKNINTIGLGPVTDAREMIHHNNQQKAAYHRNLADTLKLTTLYRSTQLASEIAGISITNELMNGTEESAEVTLPRAQFVSFLGFLIKPFDNVGATPDGLAVLSDIGFDWSFREFQALIFPTEKRNSRRSYIDRSLEERQRTEKICLNLLNRAEMLVRRRGMANLSINGLSIDAEQKDSVRKSFSFDATLHQREILETDERFTAKSYSQVEAEFFESLNRGPSRSINNREHFREMDRALLDARRGTWRDKTGPLEWLVIGICKGLSCGLARYLGFDQYAESYQATSDAQHRESLRQAVQCEILYGDSETFIIRVTYHGWYPSESTDSPLEFDTNTEASDA